MAINRVDVVDLVVDLVDVDLVDVDLAVSLCDGPRSVLFSFGLVAPTCFICFWPRRELIFRGLVRQFRQYYFPAVFPASLQPGRLRSSRVARNTPVARVGYRSRDRLQSSSQVWDES